VAAKSFFAQNNVEVDYKSIAEEKNREELVKKYGRLAVPTIIIGDRVILGFIQNKDEIKKLLGS
jgi:glutaredoxin